MTTFARTRAMHQFYRDVFTRAIHLPEADVLPAHLVVEILNYANADLDAFSETLYDADTDLAPDQDRALKLMMSAIALANAAFDGHSNGLQTRMAPEKVTLITDYVVEAMQLSDNHDYLVAAIQVLFRINEIDSVLFLISNNLSLLSENANVLKILLLICLMEEDYNQAYVVIQQLTSNPDLIGEDALTLVMVVCAIYKLGGYPDSFIDFRSLNSEAPQIDTSRYEWLITPLDNGKTTVFFACDKGYYYEHAIALLLSIYESNGTSLNVHIHVYNCDKDIQLHLETLREKLPGLAISLSSEYFFVQKAANVHYASRRFCFMPHALDKISGPILILDADCLVRKPWTQCLADNKDKEMIFAHYEGAPIWEHVPALFIYIHGGEIAKKYFATVGHFIDVNLNGDKAEWFLDQIALTVAVDKLTPDDQLKIGRVPITELIDITHSDTAFSWAVTTVKNADGRYKDYKQQLYSKYLTQA
ncbi:hypothetical protein LO739_14335 [Leclercia adecarboxylata]|uniref:hypothetical protein n=1 Tax=Leclercia adecarboxylata TaxID=83655 RepID=UPI000EBF92F1|nr:hypothetical protein [Leclercia adecarboxylata]UFM68028.1 hypothetical protein LO739_14335 [Leclercia adecarboxylata]HCC75117.1 hypothetical protein [Shigella sp.]